ncbi:uncharacterized protein LOC130742666 [Lotus japonicus]|uniref:uncharacterized protein LOC130742666 n=1 Tax=Lotus japonicus TaxID=34305 RepID=UPI0025908FE2|nr:uncharacterized protein LOC130742666 [Lotus japonicus]
MAADSTAKVLGIVFFLVLISQGYGQYCSLKDLSLSQSKTGAKVQGKPEYSVSITNKCACVQSDVKLNCRGFKTVEKIDPSLLQVLGDECLVNYGNSIYRDAVNFTYAWDRPFPLFPISSQISCS